MSQPWARSAARSASVALDPGRITRSASPGSAVPGGDESQLDVGLGARAGRGRRNWRSAAAAAPRSGSRQRRRRRTASSSPSASSAGSRRGALEPGHDAEAPQAGALLDDRRCASSNSAGSPRNLLMRIALEPRPLGLLQHRVGADQRRDHAAPVDVADQHDRQIRRAGEAHVGDVVLPQVDLGRAAGALDQHQVGLAAQSREALQHIRQQPRLELAIVRAPQRSRTPAPARPPARRSRSAA